MNCAIELGKLKVKGEKKAQADKIVKELKTKVTKWDDRLQFKINQIIRLIDNGQPCLARGIKHAQFHAGHVYSRGGNSQIRFHAHNIHRQSAHSNHFQNDDGMLRDGVIREYGKDYMDYISGLRSIEPLKYTNKEYNSLYLKASELYLKLKKEITKPLSKEDRLNYRDMINELMGIYSQ